MKKELKKKWVEALRSGKFKQTKKFLCTRKEDTQEYCCLGVLCEVMGIPKKKSYDNVYSYEFIGGTYSTRGLSQTMRHTEFGRNGQRVHYALIAMNDSGKTFSEIADWIEKNVPVRSCP